MEKEYDYLIVGTGIYGATFANIMTDYGYKCLVIDKRNYIGGDIHTENIDGINIHTHGAHIVHTSNKTVWDYLNKFAEFNNYINSPIAIPDDGKIYNMPFNMNTFCKVWDITCPADAINAVLLEKQLYGVSNPSNLEEQAISLVGKTIYDKFIKGYTEKQWGDECKNLPAFIIKRLPLRFTFNNNYFNDRYQGIPIGGYTEMINKMLQGIDVKLGVDFLKHRNELSHIAKKIVYSGRIDEYYDFKYGKLQYRTLDFVTKKIETSNFQGNAVINYTGKNTPYTRVIEHKHFEYINDFDKIPYTFISYEYPKTFKEGDIPYYPINNDINNSIYNKYKEESLKDKNVIFGGRLGRYKYLDMDKIVEMAMEDTKKERQ